MNFRTTEILHLLEVYQAIIAARPLEMGNREFSQCLISASRSLGITLLTTPKSSLVSSAELGTLQELIGEQSTANDKNIAVRILSALGELKKNQGLNHDSSRPYLRSSLPSLSRSYNKITVVFGPAMGLGDQITFFQFLRKVTASCPQASLNIFTLYPNLWRHLLPQARELSYRGRPLRPFLQLRLARNNSDRVKEKELVLFADFENFYFHRKIVPHAPSRDIVEIALGRRTAWLTRGNSPWIQFEEFFSAAVVNNYGILSSIASRFFPDTNEREAWTALRTKPARPRKNNSYLVFLNPFSSKKFPFQPRDWQQMLQRIRELLPKRVGMEVLVYPGLDATTYGYAEEICKPFAGKSSLKVRSLEDVNGFSSLTPYSAIPSLVSVLKRTDLCLTVDTFTAHFVPLFGIPTVVITLAENREFWVPGPWSFHCLIGNAERSIPALAAELLMVQVGSRTNLPQEVEAASVLIEATTKATMHGINAQSLEEIQNALVQVLQNMTPGFSYKSQGRQWLLLLSQLASAMRSEAVDLAGLEPYLFRWKESEFFKLLSLIASAQAGTNALKGDTSAVSDGPLIDVASAEQYAWQA